MTTRVLLPTNDVTSWPPQDLKQELDEGYKQMQLMGEFAEELQATEAVKETNHLEGLLQVIYFKW